jgi:hypothetical protein
LAKTIKEDVYTETHLFPSKISYSKRIRAIALQKSCTCKQCGMIHGDPDSKYCSASCYRHYRNERVLSKEKKSIANAISKGNVKFNDKTEGIDYLTCAICGAKSGDLSGHVKVHNITPAEYKVKYSIDVLKPMIYRDARRGNKNPAYNHGGKLSPWSKNFIHGYDQKRHAKKNQEFKQIRAKFPEKFKSNIEYWIVHCDGDIVTAQECYKKWQTRNLEFFINKYGLEEGTARHTAKIKKWMSTMNLKSIEELTSINTRKIKRSGYFSSKGEKELFTILQKDMPELTEQFSLCRNENANQKLFYFYDMKYQNKIIEYHGDFWHANPKFYNLSFVNPYTKKTQAEINASDADKLLVATSAGYNVHVVWEHEYKTDKNKVIEECLTFLRQ